MTPELVSSGSSVLAAASVPLVPTAWSVVVAFLIFGGGLLAMTRLAILLGHQPVDGARLYGWHTIFGLVYVWYVSAFGGDATGYYRTALEGGIAFNFGTAFVSLLTELVIATTGASFLGVSLAFNLAGSIGLLLLYDVLRSVSGPEPGLARSLVWPVVLMPSASFWTSGVGKDSLSFLAASMMTWAAVWNGRRPLAMAPAIAIMFLVRPHIGAVMLAMLFVSALGSPGGHIAKRAIHVVAVGAVITVALPAALAYVNLEEVSGLEDIDAYIEQRQQYNQEGEAGIDISGLPAPLQAATYLYRPLPHEAWSVFALVASLEVMFLLGLTLLAVRDLSTRGSAALAGRSVFLGLYSLAALYLLSRTTANLGIALRQKWMLMPSILALLLATVRRLPPKTGGTHKPPRVQRSPQSPPRKASSSARHGALRDGRPRRHRNLVS